MTAQPLRPGRDRTSGRRVGLLVAWALATGGGLLVASTTKIGPVVLTLTDDHGVHSGDLVGFALCYGAALLATLVLRPRRSRAAALAPAGAPPPSWTPAPATQWPPPSSRSHGAPIGGWTGGGEVHGANAATHRLHAAPRRPLHPDEQPTRPIRVSHPYPDSPYGRRAG